MTAKDDTYHPHLQSSPLGSDMIRAKLRSSLVDHFHSRGPVSVLGYHRWSAPSAQTPANTDHHHYQADVKLLVGDPIVLAVSLLFLTHAVTRVQLLTLTTPTGKPQDSQAVQQAPLSGVRPSPNPRLTSPGPRPAPLGKSNLLPAQPPVVRDPRQTLHRARRGRR